MNKVKPEVRVIVYLGKQEGLKQFYSVTQVTTTVGFNLQGTATIILNDKNLRLFRTFHHNIDEDNYEKKEVDIWKSFLEEYSDDPWIEYVKSISEIQSEVGSYNVLDVIFPIAGLVWIDARGRDGRWYSIFTGVILKPSDTLEQGTVGSVTLQCVNWAYFLSYFPIVVGLNNPGNYKDIETFLTARQRPEYTTKENIFQDMDVEQIFYTVVATVNQLFFAHEDSLYEGRRLWDWESFPSENTFEKAFNLTIPLLFRDEQPKASDYFPDNVNDHLAKAFIQPRFAQYEVFKRLIRSRYEFYRIDKEYAMSILQYLANSVFADIYIDPRGNLRLELPNFNSCPGVDNKYSLPFHGKNYLISHRDASVQSVTFEFNASDVVTFVEVPFTWLAPVESVQHPVFDTWSHGYSQADRKDLLTYGLREFSSTPLYSEEFPANFPSNDLKNAIAEALRLKVSQKAGKIAYRMNQRPDLELNKTILNVDRGQVHLITSITHNIVPGRSHQTNIICEYSRYAGELLPDPWEQLEKLSLDLKEQFNKPEFKKKVHQNSGHVLDAGD